MTRIKQFPRGNDHRFVRANIRINIRNEKKILTEKFSMKKLKNNKKYFKEIYSTVK